jgi:hypothetical protein
VGDELGGELGDELGGELGDELVGELGDELVGELGDELGVGVGATATLEAEAVSKWSDVDSLTARYRNISIADLQVLSLVTVDRYVVQNHVVIV